MILWIIVGILWTILMLILGGAVGVQRTHDAMKDLIPEGTSSYQIGPPGPIGPVGAPGADGKDGKDGEGYDEATWQFDRRISNLVDRVNDLENREASYQDRFRRVEKKAGMNV